MVLIPHTLICNPLVNWTPEMGVCVLGDCYLNKAVYLEKFEGQKWKWQGIVLSPSHRGVGVGEHILLWLRRGRQSGNEVILSVTLVRLILLLELVWS